MSLTLQERKAVTHQVAKRYQHATKKDKGRILDEFCVTTGFNRSYARFILRNWGRKLKRMINGVRTIIILGNVNKRLRRSPQTRKYDKLVYRAVKECWILSGCLCGKRLKPFIAEVLPILERYEELVLDADTRQKLHHISSATIDRLLSPDRAKLALKGRSSTKPGTLLKHQIPIRTFSDWNEQMPGFVEIDLVSHEGGSLVGENVFTLDLTDICTKWTETWALPNKAQRWVFEALITLRTQLPFPLRGIDSDNGSEFINHHLQAYCEQHRITFTRSRPYKKNDNCFVEQKNYSVVRKTVGYFRYDTTKQLHLLNALYQQLRLFTNFFLPAMHMTSKERHGSRVRKTYDTPMTPYHRILARPDIADESKDRLRQQYQHLNPVAIKRHIDELQDQLFTSAIEQAKIRKLLPKRNYRHNKNNPYYA